MISAFGIEHGTISKSDKRDAAVAAGAGVGAGAAGAGGSVALKRASAKKLDQSQEHLYNLVQGRWKEGKIGVPPPSNPESRAAYLNYTKHLIDKPKKQSKLLRRGGKAAAGLGALGAVGGLGVAGHKTLKSKFSKQ